MFFVFALITTQALLGAVDNLWHHEITERLPAKRSAAGELVLHAVRESIYAFVFIGLAWFRWQGAWAVLLAVVMLVVSFVMSVVPAGENVGNCRTWSGDQPSGSIAAATTDT